MRPFTLEITAGHFAFAAASCVLPIRRQNMPVCSNVATLPLPITEIAEAAPTQPGAATRRFLLDALAEPE
jgi:hypothetical protein